MIQLSIVKLGVLGSGGGTNYQAIYDATKPFCRLCGLAEVAVVISNNSTAGILARAREAGIPAVHLSSLTHPQEDDLALAIRDALWKHNAGLVILAGYMKRLGRQVLSNYANATVLNIHPALDLKRFGGQGMYGLAVHQAVIAAGEKETGATVHLVDQQFDHGPVLSQYRGVPVYPNDTPGALAARVLPKEHILYPRTIEWFIKGIWADLGVKGKLHLVMSDNFKEVSDG